MGSVSRAPWRKSGFGCIIVGSSTDFIHFIQKTGFAGTILARGHDGAGLFGVLTSKSLGK
jgi:hypothetical protein